MLVIYAEEGVIPLGRKQTAGRHGVKGASFFIGMKMTLQKLIERHRELSEEVERLSKMQKLTPNEEKNLKILKKLKLSYKDAINNATAHRRA